jgi:hypothetical protein
MHPPSIVLPLAGMHEGSCTFVASLGHLGHFASTAIHIFTPYVSNDVVMSGLAGQPCQLTGVGRSLSGIRKLHRSMDHIS